MGISLDTNLSAINALNQSDKINTNLSETIKRLSSGRRISSSENDASGMAIADSLSQQIAGLTESIKNSNDGIGLMQIADKGLGQQIDLLTQIRTKVIQASTDANSKSSLLAIQQDIEKMLDELDHIADTTSYNNLSILGGGFVNKDFHSGDGANNFVRVSIEDTHSANLGRTRFETGINITAAGNVALKFKGLDGERHLLETVTIGNTSDTGLSNLVNVINKNSDDLGIKATATVVSTGSRPLQEGLIEGLSINGRGFGNVQIESTDGKEALIKTINELSSDTGVSASLDMRGHLQLQSIDGRGIVVRADRNGELLGLSNIESQSGHHNYGRLTLVQMRGPADIVISGINFTSVGFSNHPINPKSEAEAVVSLLNIKNRYSIDEASAMGAYSNPNAGELIQDRASENTLNSFKPIGAGVLTMNGSQSLLNMLDVALESLTATRSQVAATQNQLTKTIESGLVLKTNIRSAESQIRDADFGEESTNLNTNQMLMQANVFALSKTKQIRELVLELLR